MGEMLRRPGGVFGCCGKADQLAESSWQEPCCNKDREERWWWRRRAGLSEGHEEGVVAVLILVLLWQQASEAGAGWSFSCRSRSKLQQTSGKALPLGRERDDKHRD